ncbi:MAG: hypothetical protein VYE18_03940, partial [Pseudomonadota bacterium]|nr:hypothetical protein [Pseudomonadota bacterium]
MADYRAGSGPLSMHALEALGTRYWRHNTGHPMNNADLIIATLKKAGIRRGFGIPSGNVLPLMEAMRAGGMAF